MVASTDAAGIRKPASGAGSQRLRGKDSNLDYLIQSYLLAVTVCIPRSVTNAFCRVKRLRLDSLCRPVLACYAACVCNPFATGVAGLGNEVVTTRALAERRLDG